MNYELAKKLKDSGFPQKYKQSEPNCDFAFREGGRELHLLHTDNDTGWWVGNNYNARDMSWEEMENDWVKSPTLSELIEVCGENIGMITTPSVSSHTHRFVVWLVPPTIEHDIPSNERLVFSGGIGIAGETFEEVVAKLWLNQNIKI